MADEINQIRFTKVHPVVSRTRYPFEKLKPMTSRHSLKSSDDFLHDRVNANYFVYKPTKDFNHVSIQNKVI